MYSHLIRQIEDIPVLVRTDAERLVDQAFDRVLIPALQHDPAIVSRSFCEWMTSLADARASITAHLHQRIRGHIHRDEVIHLLDAFGGRYHADHE
jgi:hypothetical protein